MHALMLRIACPLLILAIAGTTSVAAPASSAATNSSALLSRLQAAAPGIDALP